MRKVRRRRILRQQQERYRMWRLRHSVLRHFGHDPARDKKTTSAMVPRNVVGSGAEDRGKREQFQRLHGVRELSDGLDMAAQAAAGDGTPKPGEAQRRDRGGRNVRRRQGVGRKG